MRVVVYPKTLTYIHAGDYDRAEEIFYEVAVDTDMLHSMARKAAKNKSQKSSDGPLFVKVLSRRKVYNNPHHLPQEAK